MQPIIRSYTRPKYDAVSVSISKDDETTTVMAVEVEFHKVKGEKVLSEVILPPSFNKELHGMWQMELTDELRSAGFNTEELDFKRI